ncbi:hypothetical protein CMALT394_170198 [Carnobacterium maltaromaticum]|nr:hypothetical protein CMALT394_170198 [Carnobacterium maltaromaticum]
MNKSFYVQNSFCMNLLILTLSVEKFNNLSIFSQILMDYSFDSLGILSTAHFSS